MMPMEDRGFFPLLTRAGIALQKIESLGLSLSGRDGASICSTESQLLMA